MQKETVPAESSAHHKNREIPSLKEKKKKEYHEHKMEHVKLL